MPIFEPRRGGEPPRHEGRPPMEGPGHCPPPPQPPCPPPPRPHHHEHGPGRPTSQPGRGGRGF
jgi:hypothetical protein